MKDETAADEAISGPHILRFANAQGFAQRRPKVAEEAKPDAADDGDRPAEDVNGHEACADDTGHCVSCRTR